MNDPRKWAWRIPGATTAEGPFDTREEAIVHAHDCSGVPQTPVVVVGRVERPNLADYLNVEWLLEQINEETEENSWDFFHENLYSLNPADVERASAELLAWGVKWLKPTSSWRIASEEKETVCINYDLWWPLPPENLDAWSGDRPRCESFKHYRFINGVRIFKSRTQCSANFKTYHMTAAPKEEQPLNEVAEILAKLVLVEQEANS